MHRGLSRWLLAGALGVAALLAADARCGAGLGTKGDEKKAGTTGGQAKPALHVEGQLTDKDERDKTAPDCYCKTFPLQLTEGVTYQIDLKSKDFDAFLRLEDPSGNQVAEDDDSGGDLNSRIIYKAPKSGQYKVIASTFRANETGKFTLTAVVTAGGDKTTAVPPGKDKEEKKQSEQPKATTGGGTGTGKSILNVQDQLTDKDGQDPTAPGCYCKIYPVKLQEGKEYQIDLKSKDFDAFLRLEDPSGKQVAEDDDSGGGLDSRIIYKAPKSGQYKVIASTFKDKETGKFTLTIVEVGGDKVAGEPDKKKQEEKKGPATGPPSGELKVTAGQPAKVDGQLTSADPKDGQGKHSKTFAVQLQAGKSYRIYMKGNAQLDAFVKLLDETGKMVREDEFGEPNDSGINFTPDKTATYKIVATSYKGGMTGNFTLTVTQLEAGAAAAITFQKGQKTTIQGQLTNADPTDGQGKHFKAYSFQAQPGNTYTFEMVGQGGMDGYVRIEDAAGKTLKEEEFGDGKVSRVTFSAPQAGTYKVIATTFKGGMTGAFTLTASEAGGGAPGTVVGKDGQITINPGQPTVVQGQITNTDPTDKEGKHYKAFVFQAEPNKTYRFEATGQGGLDAFMRIQDMSGNNLKEEEFGDGKVSRVTFSAPQAGSYKAVVTTFKGGMTGNFTLTASVDAAGTTPPTPPVVNPRPPTVVAMPAPKQVTVAEVVDKLTDQDGIDKEGKFYKVFTFKALPNKLYRIDMNGRTFDALLRLEDEKGNQMKNEDSFEGRFSQLFFYSGKGSTVRVVASAAQPGATGGFSLSITEVTPVSPSKLESVAFERVSKFSGKLSSADGLDKEGKFYKVYVIKAEPGLSYSCEMTNKGVDPFMRLEDEKGNFIKNEDFGDGKVSRLSFKASKDKAAVFHLVASTFKPGQAGEFDLTIAERKPHAPEVLALKQGQATIEGQLAPSDDVLPGGKTYKDYAFKAEAGATYQIDLHSKAFDAYLYLKEDDGKVLAQNDDVAPGNLDSRIVYTFPKAGTYHITATSLAGGNGPFTLTVAAKSAAAPPKAKVLTLQKGQPTQLKGQLTSQDPTDAQGKHVHAYAFQAQAGKSYRFELTGAGTLDPYVRVEDDKGKVLKEEDYGDGKISRLVFKPAQAGTYNVIATAFKAGMTGEYTLTAGEVDVKDSKPLPLPLSAGKVQLDGSINGQDGIDKDGKFFKAYSFAAEAGKSYRFEMAGKGSLDPYVRIEDDKGKVVKEEDFGDGKISRVMFKAEKPGTYRLITSTFKAGMTGDFTLTGGTFEPKEAKALPLKFDAGKARAESELGPGDAQLPNGKAYKEFTFAAQAGKTYKIDMHSKALDAYLYLKDDAGKQLAENDDNGESLDSRIIHKADKAGTLHIIATVYKPGMQGPFLLTVEEFEPKAAKVEPLKFDDKGHAKVEGELTSQDAVNAQGKFFKAYSFQADAGKAIRFELTPKAGGKGLDPYVRVEDEKGKVLKEEEFGDGKVSRLIFKAGQAGTYHVVATTFKPGMTGGYVLTAGPPTDAEKLQSKVKDLPKASPEERKAVLKELEATYQKLGTKLTAADAAQAKRLADELEPADKALAAEVYATLGKILAGASDPEAARQGKVMMGAGKRLNLLGQPMQVKGVTTQGQEFDLSAMKGKVVLVDFWATWCGPCRAELPNVKKLYEKYHGQGFEVIGISLDNSETELTKFLEKEKLPWPSIYKQANELADDYGVFFIPLAILVGPDGRVLSLNARGQELDRLLEQQFSKGSEKK
jgi:thiol-disulfide isomerase/thioredoxin